MFHQLHITFYSTSQWSFFWVSCFEFWLSSQTSTRTLEVKSITNAILPRGKSSLSYPPTIPGSLLECTHLWNICMPPTQFTVLQLTVLETSVEHACAWLLKTSWEFYLGLDHALVFFLSISLASSVNLANKRFLHSLCAYLRSFQVTKSQVETW